MTNTKTRTGGRILVDQLVIQGCDRIFSVPGESFLAVLDALHDTPQIQNVVCRQEGGVTFMACADGTLTGRPGVAFVTRGPGATNASIGVHVAMQDSQPMILFIGDVDRGMKDREGFQEVDFPAMFGPLCKWAARIDDPARIPEYVARAYQVAMSGRPGPVVLALPEDMLCEEADALDRKRVEPVVQATHPDQMADLAARLKAAKAPVAIIGGAGWTPKAARELLQRRPLGEWQRIVRDDLLQMNPDLDGAIERIDVRRWGHAMIRPEPGFLTDPARLAAQALHHDVGGAVGRLLVVVDVHEPGVLDQGDGARFF